MLPKRIGYRILLAVGLILTVLTVGAVGFHVLEGWPLFDGLYMTLITMTTVGYGEVRPLSQLGRMFNTVLIVTSVMVGGLLIATFTQAMLEFELNYYFGRRRLERNLAKMKDHYIICGAGRVGRTVSKELHSKGVPCVIVERDPQRAEWAAKEGIPVLIGSGATEESLKQARIEFAKGLVSAVTTDADNLYIVLTASGMRPDMQIIARASEEEAISKLKRAGATQVLSPYHFVGQRIVQLVLRPHVIDFLDSAFGERVDIQIEEVHLDEKSELAGKTIGEANLRKRMNVIIVAVKHEHGEMIFNPAPEEKLTPGDHVIAVGSTADLQKLEVIAGRRAHF
jgi:voltage-gated potassium channel